MRFWCRRAIPGSSWERTADEEGAPIERQSLEVADLASLLSLMRPGQALRVELPPPGRRKKYPELILLERPPRVSAFSKARALESSDTLDGLLEELAEAGALLLIKGPDKKHLVFRGC